MILKIEFFVSKILNGMIDSLELKIRETKFQILLKCKDFRVYLIDFPSVYHCQGIYKSLDALSNISMFTFMLFFNEFIRKYFTNIDSDNMKIPFFTQLSSKTNPYDWMLYSIEEDFHFFFGCKSDDSSTEWRISDLNRDFLVCPTYPPRLIVPRSIDDSMLTKSSQFRANGRFPVLSYYHKKNKVRKS